MQMPQNVHAYLNEKKNILENYWLKCLEDISFLMSFSPARIFVVMRVS